MKLKSIILSFIILPVLSFSQITPVDQPKDNKNNPNKPNAQADEIPMTEEESKLFHQINHIRTIRKQKPLRFSKTLYDQARSQSEELSAKGLKTMSVKMKRDNSTEQRSISLQAAGPAYLEEFHRVLKWTLSLYHIIIDDHYSELALSISKNPKTGLQYLHVILRKSDIDTDSLSLEKQQFLPLLSKWMDSKFGLNERTLKRQLDKYLHDATGKYSSTPMASGIIIYSEDRVMPRNYIRFDFSNGTESYPGIHSKSYFFREQNSADERKRLEAIYNAPEKKNSPSYFHRLDINKRFMFWVTDEEIVECRWFGAKGVYVNITRVEYLYQFIRRYYKRYGLKYPISRRLYLQLLKETLRITDQLNVTDFLRSVSIRYQSEYRESKILLNFGNQRIFILRHYNGRGKKSRDILYRNDKKVLTNSYQYSQDKLSRIDVKAHIQDENSGSYEIKEK
ncbi:MAG: hypothetical protein OEZ36_08885 [Spirochaetota bacterium]|nr:hypothetical protein [Spirochaetota bacterium]